MTAMAFLSLTFCCIWPEGGGQDRNEECGWGLPLSKATDAVRRSSLASPRFCAPSGPGMTTAPTCCWYSLIPVDFLNLAHNFVYNLLNIPQITHFECVFIAKTLINTIFYLYTFGISPSKVCVCVCTLSPVQLFVIPCTAAHQAPLSTQFFQMRIQEWVAISFFGDLPEQGSNLHLFCLLQWQADSLPLCHLGNPLFPLLFHKDEQPSKVLSLTLSSSLHILYLKPFSFPQHVIIMSRASQYIFLIPNSLSCSSPVFSTTSFI